MALEELKTLLSHVNMSHVNMRHLKYADVIIMVILPLSKSSVLLTTQTFRI